MLIKDGNMRRFPRFHIRGVLGAITEADEAEVLDLSMGGALVEHRGTFRVGGSCFLDLPTAGMLVSIRCRVVYSGESRREPEGTLYYRTGVEFLDLTFEAERALGALIRSYGARKDKN